MIIVTAGNKYLDIDAYASGIAYSLLLKENRLNCKFISSAEFNMSICDIVKNLGYKVQKRYRKNDNDQFILLDLSNPEFFDRIVNQEKIIEIIDHHTGFEDYWKQKNVYNQIEFIGSVATIIYEKIIESGKEKLLDEKLCKLLICAILDNTLNLKSNITTKRDIDAYNALHRLGKVPKSFDADYFNSCQDYINKDVVQAVINDIKMERVSNCLPEVFGQLTIYNKEPIFDKLDKISEYMSMNYKQWILNVICIKDGKSYLYTTDQTSQEKVATLFGKNFNKNILVLDKFMLRKEIMKKAREK